MTYTSRANIWSLPIPASGTVDTSSARAITSGNQNIEAMRVSWDKQWLLFDSTLHVNSELFRVPIGGGTQVRITTDPADDFAPDLSPDGREVAYHSWRTGIARHLRHAGGRRPLAAGHGDGGARELPDLVTGRQARSPSSTRSVEGGANPRTVCRSSRPIRELELRRWLSAREPSCSRQAPGASRGCRRGGFLPIAPQWRPRNYRGRLGISARGVRARRRVPAILEVEGVVAAEDGRTLYFKSHDAEGRASFWSVPTAGGRPRLLVRFNDPSRVSIRADFAAGAGQLFFTFEDRQADIWMADISRR